MGCPCADKAKKAAKIAADRIKALRDRMMKGRK